MTRRRVCKVADLGPGELRRFRVAGLTFALGRHGDRFYAFRDSCPHQGAPLSGGSLGGTIVAGDVGEFRYDHDGEIVRCPWHGWEFDARTGRSLHDPASCRIGTYETIVDGEDVYLLLGR